METFLYMSDYIALIGYFGVVVGFGIWVIARSILTLNL